MQKPLDLTKIRARLAATHSPYVKAIRGGEQDQETLWEARIGEPDGRCVFIVPEGDRFQTDLIFALRAPEDVDALCTEVEQLREEVADLRGETIFTLTDVKTAQEHGNALYRALVAQLEPHVPSDSRDLDWDVLPNTLGALARERDALRAQLVEAQLQIVNEETIADDACAERDTSRVQERDALGAKRVAERERDTERERVKQVANLLRTLRPLAEDEIRRAGERSGTPLSVGRYLTEARIQLAHIDAALAELEGA